MWSSNTIKITYNTLEDSMSTTNPTTDEIQDFVNRMVDEMNAQTTERPSTIEVIIALANEDEE